MRFLPFIVLTGASLLPLKAVAASETTGDPITNPPTTPMPKEAVTSDSTESGNLPTTDPAPPAEPPTTSTTTVSTPTTTQRETTQPTAPTPRTTSPTPEATQGHKAVSIDCLKEANEVREKIGFSAFKGPTGDEQKLPIEGIIASAKQQQQPEPEGGSGTSKNPIYSIICLSTPQALKNNQEPFTQEEWNQITGVGNNSTIPTVFAALTLAAAAFMHALF
ncbi:hypothetical protein Emed_000891 [Eimeria media]